MQETLDILDLHAVIDRGVENLSGGELQRFAIGVVIVQRADVYMFDEPSSYLDVMQRLKAARAIRSLLKHDTFVITVEHDLSVLDYLSCAPSQPHRPLPLIASLFPRLPLVRAFSTTPSITTDRFLYGL